MDTLVDTQAAAHPGGQGGKSRSGQSGEGARSAMEQLIQQEKKRDAQLPREDNPPGNDAAPAA
jgi:hypothetical protein